MGRRENLENYETYLALPERAVKEEIQARSILSSTTNSGGRGLGGGGRGLSGNILHATTVLVRFQIIFGSNVARNCHLKFLDEIIQCGQ